VFISRIELQNFRNYADLEVELGPGLNLFVGDNAQGKSNLLEAIYLLSTLRSSRASTDSDLVRREVIETEFPIARLVCDAQRQAGLVQLEVAVVGRGPQGSERAGKRVRVNGVVKRASEAVGELAAVLFTTLDIEIVAGPPLMRRRYLDMMISQVDRGYLRAMQRYSRVLPQRNSLLKRIQAGDASAAELSFWDQELAHQGGIIFTSRSNALAGVVPAAAEQMAKLSDGRERLDITYKPALGALRDVDSPLDSEGWIQRTLSVLADSRSKEIGAGTTLYGPHRDDFEVEIDGLAAGAFGSRGQQRTAALALRVAEATYLRDSLGDGPVVLLDDILSELDAGRRKGVLDFLGQFQQVLVTTSEPDRVRDVLTKASGRFVVVAGALSRFEGE